MMGDEWQAVPIGVKITYPMADPDTEADLKAKGLRADSTALARDIGPWRLNCKLPDGKEVIYTRDDLMANKPYPGPAVRRASVGQALRGQGRQGVLFLAAAQGAAEFTPDAGDQREAYVQDGNIEVGRDAALRLVRMAYYFPNIDPGRYFGKLVASSSKAYVSVGPVLSVPEPAAARRV